MTRTLPPRLLTPSAARRYLGGHTPAEFDVAPMFVRGEELYDRSALDAKLDALSGIRPAAAADDPNAHLQDWLSRRGAS